MAGIGDIAKAASTDKDKIQPGTVKRVFEALIKLVTSGETASIQGLGNFRVVDRKATKARNPKTGAQFDVGPSKRMKFQASKTLKDTLNPNQAKPSPAKPAATAAPKAAAGGKP